MSHGPDRDWGGLAQDALEFDVATGVERERPGHFVAHIDASWFGGAGPSGGYLAAIILRALGESVGEPARVPRTLSCAFMSSPTAGLARIDVTVQKIGRAVSFLCASLSQGERRCVNAWATFAVGDDGSIEYCDVRLPPVPRASELPTDPVGPADPPVLARLDVRPVRVPGLGAGQGKAVRSAWVRLLPPRQVDVLAQCFLGDALLPSPVERLSAPLLAPTIEYAVHFWSPSRAPLSGGEHVFVQTSSACASEGFFEEEGFIFGPNGNLLVRTRQLALLR